MKLKSLNLTNSTLHHARDVVSVNALRDGFEFLFVRLAPIVFLTSVVGVVVTYKKR